MQAPVWSLPDADLVAGLATVHREQQRLAAVSLALVREIDGRGLGVREGASSTVMWLRGRLNLTGSAASKLVRLAAALDAGPPVVREALAAGRLDVEQARVLAEVVTALPAEAADKAAAVLVGHAAQFDPVALRRLGERVLAHVAPELAEQAERKALEAAEASAERDRFFTLTPAGDGGVRLYGRMGVEAAAIVAAALDPLCSPVRGDDRSPGQRRADALTEICQRVLAGGELPDNGGDRPQIVVTVPFDVTAQALKTGWLDTGATISPTAVRRLACDAKIIPAVLGRDGQVLDVGRERRLFNVHLRRALVLRDGGCAFPDCDRPARWAEGHHVKHWADGGTTEIDNAVLLCGYHHRLIHAGDWRVRIADDGRPEFIPPKWLDPTGKARRNSYHRRL